MKYYLKQVAHRLACALDSLMIWSESVNTSDDKKRNKIKRMLSTIVSETRATSRFTGREELNPKVLAAMEAVPREKFVPLDLKYFAYENGPLSLGHGQTISQPFIVALMTDLLEPQSHHVVLEVGTGSGYQAAVLSQLCKTVYSIEIIEPLATEATKRLKNLHYDNIVTRQGNGYYGWIEHAPYDSIIVTAAATHIPNELIEQLRNGGKMVIPVGPGHFSQELMLLEKDQQGVTHISSILGVVFVPLKEGNQKASEELGFN